MGASSRDPRAYPHPDNNPHGREVLQRQLDAATAEVELLCAALATCVCGPCLARPAGEYCWTHVVPNRGEWWACEAARRALPPGYLAPAAAAYAAGRRLRR